MTIGALSGLGMTKLCSIISIVLTSARIPSCHDPHSNQPRSEWCMVGTYNYLLSPKELFSTSPSTTPADTYLTLMTINLIYPPFYFSCFVYFFFIFFDFLEFEHISVTNYLYTNNQIVDIATISPHKVEAVRILIAALLLSFLLDNNKNSRTLH